MTAEHQLIGAPVSLYTGKLRSYLRRKNIPFTEVLATAEVYRDVILPRTGVRYIPILITCDDQAVQDTTVIIDLLEQRYPEASVYPDGPTQRLVALLLEVYGDEWLVIPAMHYRWNIPENRAFALAEFGRTSAPHASAETQSAIAGKLSKPFAGALPGLGVHEHTVSAIEESYLALLGELDRHFQSYPFLLGDRPCIGDYGLLGPLYAHLYRVGIGLKTRSRYIRPPGFAPDCDSHGADLHERRPHRRALAGGAARRPATRSRRVRRSSTRGCRSCGGLRSWSPPQA